MKPFFSIEVKHEYADSKKTDHLKVVPTRGYESYQRNDRLRFRAQPGGLNCYIEQDESVKEELKSLLFWVVCTDDSFYQYTDYPQETSFGSPFFYWTNLESKSNELLASDMKEALENEETEVSEALLKLSPKSTVGCLELMLCDISLGDDYSMGFDVKKTIWEYRIFPKETEKNWVYQITDFHKKWKFKMLDKKETSYLVFQSEEPIGYFKRAESRLKLIWSSDNKFLDDKELALPFANFAHQSADREHGALTPIYIHI